MIQATFTTPVFTINDRLMKKLLTKVGGKVATRARKALRSGTDYQGNQLPAGANGEAIDLRDTGALIRSIKYKARLQEIGPFASHPTASKRAGSAYGLASILMSGKGKDGTQIRDPFDLFGTPARQRVYEDMANLFEEELNKAGDQAITSK